MKITRNKHKYDINDNPSVYSNNPLYGKFGVDIVDAVEDEEFLKKIVQVPFYLEAGISRRRYCRHLLISTAAAIKLWHGDDNTLDDDLISEIRRLYIEVFKHDLPKKTVYLTKIFVQVLTKLQPGKSAVISDN
jgi:hypothetical protein